MKFLVVTGAVSYHCENLLMSNSAEVPSSLCHAPFPLPLYTWAHTCRIRGGADEKIETKLAEGLIYIDNAVDEMIPWGQMTFSIDLQLLPAGDAAASRTLVMKTRTPFCTGMSSLVVPRH